MSPVHFSRCGPTIHGDPPSTSHYITIILIIRYEKCITINSQSSTLLKSIMFQVFYIYYGDNKKPRVNLRTYQLQNYVGSFFLLRTKKVLTTTRYGPGKKMRKWISASPLPGVFAVVAVVVVVCCVCMLLVLSCCWCCWTVKVDVVVMCCCVL